MKPKSKVFHYTQFNTFVIITSGDSQQFHKLYYWSIELRTSNCTMKKQPEEHYLSHSLIDGYILASTYTVPEDEIQRNDNNTPIDCDMENESENSEEDCIYVLKLVVSQDESKAVAAWSDCCLRVYDVTNGASIQEIYSLVGHQDRITGLKIANSDQSLIFSCAEDGVLAGWDMRSGSSMVQKFQVDGNAIFSSMDIGCDDQLLVGGTENGEESKIYFWDRRSSKVLGKYQESHFDGITELMFHPTQKTRLASGSLDGLVCYFDITKAKEEDALLSVMNAEGPVSKIGYFGPEMQCVYSLTFSETFSMFHAEKAERMAQFTNLREDLNRANAPSDFLVDCCYIQGSSHLQKNQTLVLVSGNHDGSVFLSDITLGGVRKLCEVKHDLGHTSAVRSAAFTRRDPLSGIPLYMMTGGEDGNLCGWRHQSNTLNNNNSSTGANRRKKTKLRKLHPY